MIQIIRTGRSHKFVPLGRTHRIWCALLAEFFDALPYTKIDVTETIDQAADIYTKTFNNSSARLH
eukprot:256345-Prorocentrum_lima.AAC.1